MAYHTNYQLFEKHLPPNAVAYCFDLWQKDPCQLKITRNRKSKLGDYRFNRLTGGHAISVNGTLNTYAFLITFLHEMAHYVTFRQYGRKVKPHGTEWKKTFQELITPMLNDLVFPEDILAQLRIHMKNPKASSAADHKLSHLLRKYDTNTDASSIEDVAIGNHFMLDGKIYQKKSALRRTRYLCRDVHKKRDYLISRAAIIKPLPEDKQVHTQ